MRRYHRAPLPAGGESDMLVFLRTSGSAFCASLAARIGREARALDVDAALRGDEVSVCGSSVRWQGVELDRAALVFVERPLYPWPQSLEPDAPDARRVALREALSLSCSALRALALEIPVVNPPALASLAASPAVALASLEREGVAVHPYRLGARGASEVPALDLAGGAWGAQPLELDLDPNECTLAPEPCAGPLFTALALGGELLGAARCDHLADFCARRSDPTGCALAVERVPQAQAALAIDAARALGLPLAAVTTLAGEDGARVVALDSAPDLCRWDAALSERLAAPFARRLAVLARNPLAEARR